MFWFHTRYGIPEAISEIAGRVAELGWKFPDEPITFFVAAKGKTFHHSRNCAKAVLSPVALSVADVLNPGTQFCARKNCKRAGFYAAQNAGWEAWLAHLTAMVNLHDVLTAGEFPSPFEKFQAVQFRRFEAVDPELTVSIDDGSGVHPDFAGALADLVERADRVLASMAPEDPFGFLTSAWAGARIEVALNSSSGAYLGKLVERWSASDRICQLFPKSHHYVSTPDLVNSAIGSVSAKLRAGVPFQTARDEGLAEVRQWIAEQLEKDPWFCPLVPLEARLPSTDFDHPAAWMAAEWRREALETMAALFDGAFAGATKGFRGELLELVAVRHVHEPSTYSRQRHRLAMAAVAAAQFAYPHLAYDGRRLSFAAIPRSQTKALQTMLAETGTEVLAAGVGVKTLNREVLECAETLWSDGTSISVTDAVRAARMVIVGR